MAGMLAARRRERNRGRLARRSCILEAHAAPGAGPGPAAGRGPRRARPRRQEDRSIPHRIHAPIVAVALAAATFPAPPGRAGAAPDWEPDRRLTRHPAPARTSINFARSIAADDVGRVHVVWSDERDGNAEIYTKRSIDGGASWGPPVRLTDEPTASNNPSIAVAGERVHVVWWDWRTGSPQVRHRRSADGGGSWGPDRALTSGGTGAHASIAAEGASVQVVYVDGRDGNAEVYHLRSADGGDSWSAAARLSSLPFNSYTPTVAVSGPNVYAAWTDTRHGGSHMSLEEEYFRRSADGGATWEPEQRLTADPEGQPASSWAPSLAAQGARVWITWFDDRSGNWEIYAKRSSDHGASWSPDERLTFDAGASQRPSIAVHGTDVHVAWWDTRDANNEIYAIRSRDLGETWDPPRRLTENPGSSTLVSAAAAASGVHLAWRDDRDGAEEIYYKRLPGEPVSVGNGRIAFTRMVGADPQIFTAGPDGSDVRQLTFTGRNTYPAWSRDGSKIAFSASRGGPHALWVMDADGSNPVALGFGSAGGDFVPDWSHDGTRLAYASVDPAVGHPEVWVATVSGSERGRLTFTPPNPGGPTWSLHPTWYPGDRWIYYASTASGSSQIWGMFPNGQGQERKTNGLGPGYPDANVPEFSRGGILTFWSGIERQYGEVWVWSLGEPTGPRRITETPDPRSSDNPAWSPDGSKILFDSNRSGSVEVFVTDADGGAPLALLPGAFGQTSWQPIPGRGVVSAGGPRPPARRGIALRGAPNPSTGGFTLSFDVPRPARVEARVLDAAGRVVRRLFSGEAAAGPARLGWDGRDAAGRLARPGVYFVTVTAAGETASARVTVRR